MFHQTCLWHRTRAASSMFSDLQSLVFFFFFPIQLNWGSSSPSLGSHCRATHCTTHTQGQPLLPESLTATANHGGRILTQNGTGWPSIIQSCSTESEAKFADAQIYTDLFPLDCLALASPRRTYKEVPAFGRTADGKGGRSALPSVVYALLRKGLWG